MHLLSDILGRPAADIDTPALVIDLDAMERNLIAMAAFAAQHRVRLRPHAKMHKSATIAKLQMAHGAVGVCVQKTSEAEALAALGVNNIYISNEALKACGAWRRPCTDNGASSGSSSRSMWVTAAAA
jgi:D-serine deaminase-like pyridoxal phosphate-dependent protein